MVLNKTSFSPSQLLYMQFTINKKSDIISKNVMRNLRFSTLKINYIPAY